MVNAYRLLPPLGNLIGFEAAARLGSFSLAAAELNMTQSAISHQIRTLETHLQQPLFLRINRRVELTDAGRDLQITSETALETIRQGVRRLDAYSKPGSVVLHMPPALATLWFLPRLVQFRAMHPDVEPWLFTSNAQIDLTEAEVDITVTSEQQRGEDIVAAPFFRDERVPLASPTHAAEFRDTLDAAPLLHDEHPDDWQSWFMAAGITRQDFAAGLNFSDSALALDAAVRNLGMCLGSRALAQPMIVEGKLEVVNSTALPAADIHYVVTLERNLQRDGVRLLWDWLLAEAGQDSDAAASSGK